MPIHLDVTLYIVKNQSLGSAECFGLQRPITIADLLNQGLTITLQGQPLGGHFDMPLLVELCFVGEHEHAVQHREELLDIFISSEHFAHIVYLPALVRAAWIGKEQDARPLHGTRCNIDPLASRVTPHRMEFGLDVDTGALPNGPAILSTPAMLTNLCINHREALVLQRALEQSARQISQRASGTT